MAIDVITSKFNRLLLNMAIYVVSFPIKNGGSFHSYVSNLVLIVNAGWWFGTVEFDFHIFQRG